MVRCNSCGKEISAGAGHQTATRGFICYECSSALGMQLCADCGQRFPFDEMVEHLGNFYCRDDFRIMMARIESYAPKPKPKGPPLKGGGGLRIRPRTAKAKVPYESMAGEVKRMAEPAKLPLMTPSAHQNTGEKGAEMPKDDRKEKEEMRNILDEISNGVSLKKDRKEDAFDEILKALRDSVRGKKY